MSEPSTGEVLGEFRRGFLERLDRVKRRLEHHASNDAPTGLTEADPSTGERWEAGQVWAHLAEILPYWAEQVRIVVAAASSAPLAAPAPFGRVRSDPGRIAAIERDRREDPAALMERTRLGIDQTRDLVRGLSPDAWNAKGQHQTLGEMPVSRIVEEFMVRHLEDHADQLDGLAVAPGEG